MHDYSFLFELFETKLNYFNNKDYKNLKNEYERMKRRLEKNKRKDFEKTLKLEKKYDRIKDRLRAAETKYENDVHTRERKCDKLKIRLDIVERQNMTLENRLAIIESEYNCIILRFDSKKKLLFM